MVKNAKIKIIIAVVLIIIISAGIFAYARYVSTLTGQGVAVVARWSFKVNGSSSTAVSINLAETINDVHGKVTSQEVAPGTSGAFDIEIDGSGSDVEMYWNIKINQFANLPRNLKFYETNVSGVYSDEIVSSFGTYEVNGNIALADIETPVIKTIYWNWPYETGITEQDITQNDIIDTEDSGKQVTCSIRVTGEQGLNIKGSPLVLANRTAGTLENYKIYGNSQQQNLPSEYQEVEYLESTGTQRIETNFSGNIFVKGIGQYTSLSSGYIESLFGQSSGGARWFGITDQILRNRDYVYSQNPLEEFEFFMQFNFNGLTCTNIITIGSESSTRTFVSSYPLDNLSLFDIKNTTLNIWQNPSKARLKTFEIYSDNTMVELLGKLVPCYRKLDNEIGMYDTVNNVFYTNTGTGTFIAGPIATLTPDTPIDVVSLGENGRINVITTATDFEQDIEPIITEIDLTGHEPLRKVGDAADYIDFKRGKIVRNIAKYSFMGDEQDFDWKKSVVYPGGYYLNWDSLNGNGNYTKFLCSHVHMAYDLTNYDVGTGYTDSAMNLRISDGTVINTIEKWKNYLAEQYANGTPVIIYYQTAIPIEEDITLPSIPTVEGRNIITVTDGEISASNIEIGL